MGRPYQIWHDQWLTSYGRSCLSADTITVISKCGTHRERVLDDCPRVGDPQGFTATRALYVSRLENPPPNRCCYKIKHRSP